MTRSPQVLLGLVTLLFTALSNAAPPNSYPKLEIDSRQVYSLSAFPYYDYFVCLQQTEQGMDALEHLQHDPVFQQSLRKVAGEAAARQYRYLNELPAKRAFFTNNVTSDSFPQKEQVPFGNDEGYRYSYQYLKQPNVAYQYDFETKGMYREMFDRGSKRHWLLIGMTFLQRESDWKVSRLPDTPELVILGTIDIKQIQAANNELAAYENAQKNLELYYFKSEVKDCY